MKWENVKLGVLIDIKTGKLDANESSDTGLYPFFTCSTETLKIDRYSFDCEAVLVAGNGDLNVKYYKGKFDAYQRTYVIKSCDVSKLNTKYLYYFLSSYISILRNKSIGGVIKYIKLNNLTEPLIPLPPLHIQKQIADTLDKADALRRKDQELLQKYDDLAQAIFYDMFGDPETNEKNWAVKTLEEVTTKLGDGLHGTPVYDENGEYFFINGNNLCNGIISYTKDTKRISHEQYLKHKKPLNQDSLLVSINGTIGNVAFYNGEKIILGKSACYFNINRNFLTPDYIFYLVSSDYFLKYATSASTGSTIKNVSLRTMRDLPVPLPPLEIQNRFTDILVLYKTGFSNLKSCKNTNGLYSSLMNRFFS